MHDLDALLDLATRTAVAAGALLLERRRAAPALVETKTSLTDMVTETDRASEALIAAAIRRQRPGDAILAEEGTADTGTSGVRWVVDPLDGTTNFLYGFPAFGVSLAAEVDGRPAVGVVHDPWHRETFTAATGRGAWRDGERLRVAGAPDLATALVGTGFAYDARRRASQGDVLRAVLPSVRDIRRAGAAALDLCWVALGRLDAFYERGLQPWDLAAGSVVAVEAGALVGTLDDGTFVAAPPQLFGPLCDLLAEAGRTARRD